MDENKPIYLPFRLSESFVASKSEWIFLYGYDFLQKGAFGQCVYFRSQPNSIAIPTLYKYCANPVYWNDNSLARSSINDALKRIPSGKVVIPCKKLGCGCSRLQELAPMLYAWLMEELKKICYPNIIIDYNQQYANRY